MGDKDPKSIAMKDDERLFLFQWLADACPLAAFTKLAKNVY